MANNNAPFGLRLYEQSPDGHSELVLIPSTDSHVYGRGDAVKTAGDSGSIGQGPTVKTVLQIAAGDAIYGVIQGFEKLEVAASSFNLDSTCRPASVAMYAMVRVANNQDVYEMQADDVGGAFAHGDMGNNANITGNGGGTSITDANATNGLSTMEIDTSTKQTTATLQVKLLSPCPRADNVQFTTNANYLVRINNSEVSGGTGTAGV